MRAVKDHITLTQILATAINDVLNHHINVEDKNPKIAARYLFQADAKIRAAARLVKAMRAK